MSAVWIVILIVLISAVFFKRPSKGESVARKRVRKKDGMNRKIVKRLTGGYVTILLLSTLLYYMLPYHLAKMEMASSLEQDRLNPFTITSFTQLSQSKDVKQLSQKVITYEGKSLNLTNEDENTIPVFIERKQTDDGKVEVTQFAQRSFVNQIDITNQIPSQEIKMIGDTLLVSKPNQVHVELASFDQEFTITQFKGGNFFSNHGVNYGMGTKLLYLRIPKNLKISESTNLDLHYLD